jgi:NAD(P)-dependent dehydrogenase (short-subunit alcohol dehydrogenase family)
MLEQVAEQVRTWGRTATVLPLDLRDDRATRAAAEQIRSDRLPDVVIANAGHSIARSVLDCVRRPDSYQRTVAVNYLGAVAFLSAFLPGMVERGRGTIVGVTTINARVPAPGWAPYCASKAAFDAWLRCAQAELRPFGVRTSMVALPLVDTEMVRPVYGDRPALAMSAERAARMVLRAASDAPPRVCPWWTAPLEIATAAAPTTSARLLGWASGLQQAGRRR